MPDPRYVCASCGGESLEWRSLCPHCGSFDCAGVADTRLGRAGAGLPIVGETGLRVPEDRPRTPADALERAG